jgi:hypothetical protein
MRTGCITQVPLNIKAITNFGDERRRKANGFSAGKKVPNI